MGLTSWLLRLTPPRPLLLAGPGGTRARLAVERLTRERGWHPASSPAEANLLVITGEGLEPYATRVWEAMPAPKVRVRVTSAATVPTDLTEAVNTLHDATTQRLPATTATPATPTNHADHADHAAMAHDHTDHMTAMPGGIPMADRADDRDGLELDQLHVPLGPALPLWPAGLIIHTTLQGDVIREASVEVIEGTGESFWPEHPVARALDSTARLLAVAGWSDAATTAQRLRDDSLRDATPTEALHRWVRRIRGSRTLRRLLEGVGETVNAPPPLAGDALSRLNHRLAATTQPHHHVPESPQWTIDVLPTLLAGTELATARLIVASLDPDPDLLPRHEPHQRPRPKPHHDPHDNLDHRPHEQSHRGPQQDPHLEHETPHSETPTQPNREPHHETQEPEHSTHEKPHHQHPKTHQHNPHPSLRQPDDSTNDQPRPERGADNQPHHQPNPNHTTHHQPRPEHHTPGPHTDQASPREPHPGDPHD
ncbi:hypothetical protein [Actinophytocola oryzae]|uniref:Uncharacterized protein n=1 Tax=Actinophytocola oryzae TaxID=502181 RepID=A0A4R7W5E6_9PSEU|nr:hypothetical protein [Actinophytocola oryzae]TDV57318.1 hypothetical protein CLV71_101189 [Actinophytocola oryzae]